MIHTAELLKVFQQYRGDALVIPGRGGRHWVQLSTSRIGTCPWVIRPWAAMPRLPWAWRWRSRIGKSCCLIPRAMC